MATYHYDYLKNYAHETQTEVDGRWVAARPERGPFLWRIRSAWLVLTGKADAVRWPAGQ
jgi:hypothetical protein